LRVAGAETVRESGIPVAKADGVKFLAERNGKAIFAVDWGRYRFTAKPATEQDKIRHKKT